MAIDGLKVLILCLFVASNLPLCATEPVTNLDRTSLYLSNERVDINLNTIKFRKQKDLDYAYRDWIDKKNSLFINFQDHIYLSNPYLWDLYHSDRNIVNSGQIGIQPYPMNLKKTDFQGILSNVAQAYVYQLNVQLLVQSYRELLLSGFSSITKDFLDGSPSNANEFTTGYFGHFYHSLVDMININMDFGKFGVDPSLGFGFTGVKCSYKFLYGTISSFWNMDQNKISLRVRIPFNYSRIIHNSIVKDLSLPAQEGH